MAYIMTAKRKAALRKAQLASARKRKKFKSNVKRKYRRAVSKARKNSQPAARKALKVSSNIAAYGAARRMVGPRMANGLYASYYLNKAANGAYSKKKKKK